jgi:hypothetical protein
MGRQKVDTTGFQRLKMRLAYPQFDGNHFDRPPETFARRPKIISCARRRRRVDRLLRR